MEQPTIQDPYAAVSHMDMTESEPECIKWVLVVRMICVDVLSTCTHIHTILVTYIRIFLHTFNNWNYRIKGMISRWLVKLAKTFTPWKFDQCDRYTTAPEAQGRAGLFNSSDPDTSTDPLGAKTSRGRDVCHNYLFLWQLWPLGIRL